MKACLILLIGLFCLSDSVFAVYDPLSVPNNKFGIHIADPQDIPDAAHLVNNNGDWGYVTVVIQEDDRNTDKWQRIFNQMRRLRVIPLVRIATRPVGNTWKKPELADIRDWRTFLSSLNWPTENRYVIIFNEPNHAAEWGNSINPEEYADIFVTYAKALKESSPDFYILPAGFDASAPNGATTLDQEVFLRRMVTKQPEILSLLDGWTSHAYPNPAFSAPPGASGRISLRGYEWELSLLRTLGETRSLPIFITETGWRHREGLSTQYSYLSTETVAQYIKTAATGAWADPRIVAITPFIINYQGLPFDHFSMRRLGGDGFYPHYYAYRDLPKEDGAPKQKESYEIVKPLLPSTLIGDATTTLIGEIKNTGQAILNSDNYRLQIKDESGLFPTFAESLPTLEPGETGKIVVHITTPVADGTYTLQAVLFKGHEEIPLETVDVTIIPPPLLSIEVSAGWRPNPTVSDISVLVYDEREYIVHEFNGLSLSGGTIQVRGIKNVVPGIPYRIVILAPGYLPRQAHVTFGISDSVLPMNRLLPLDFNNDGTFSTEDIFSAFSTRPHDAWYRFFGP